jgi:hypothetical protein
MILFLVIAVIFSMDEERGYHTHFLKVDQLKIISVPNFDSFQFVENENKGLLSDFMKICTEKYV